MRRLVILRIKNSDFDFSKYGLYKNYFAIDVSDSLSYSRGVGFTQYALLDGTTRVDNISRQPASISLQGKLGEVAHTRDWMTAVNETDQRSRLQNQMDLLEALRDNAIFLDFITDERTYRDYLIESVSFGKNRAGLIEAQISAKEILTFGDNIDIDSPEYRNPSEITDEAYYLDLFRMNPIESDDDLKRELNRVLRNSSLTNPYIIYFGSIDNQSDVVLEPYETRNEFSEVEFNTMINKMNSNSNYTTQTSSRTHILQKEHQAIDITSGSVQSNKRVRINLPMLKNKSSFASTTFTKPAGVVTNQNVRMDISGINISVRTIQDDKLTYSIGTADILRPPRYESIANSDSIGYISSALEGLSFIRKLKNNKYTVISNLSHLSTGDMMYSATYTTTRGSSLFIQPALVFIEDKAWRRIKEELKRVWSESKYFSSKELLGI